MHIKNDGNVVTLEKIPLKYNFFIVGVVVDDVVVLFGVRSINFVVKFDGNITL